MQACWFDKPVTFLPNTITSDKCCGKPFLLSSASLAWDVLVSWDLLCTWVASQSIPPHATRLANTLWRVLRERNSILSSLVQVRARHSYYSGSAGCVVASELHRRFEGKASVLLVEAGPESHEENRFGGDPTKFFGEWMYSDTDWDYFIQGGPSVNNRCIPSARGRTTGGCSAANASMWVWGTPEGSLA